MTRTREPGAIGRRPLARRQHEWFREGEKRGVDLALRRCHARQRVFGNEDEVRESAVNSCAEEAHVCTDVGPSGAVRCTRSAGNLGGQSHLCSNRWNVDAGGELLADAPHARRDLVTENHTGGDSDLLLPRCDPKIRPAQGCGLDREEDLAWLDAWHGPTLERQRTRGLKRDRAHEIHGARIRHVSHSTHHIEQVFDMVGAMFNERRYAELHAH